MDWGLGYFGSACAKGFDFEGFGLMREEDVGDVERLFVTGWTFEVVVNVG